MKNYIKTIILFAITLFATNSFAYTAPSPPPNGTYVLDLANKLSTEQVNALNDHIQGIKNNTTNEFAVLILQNMDGSSIDDVRYTVFNAWGVGKRGLDNGVLIVIAVSEKKTGIETGKGVGELTDLQSNDILANILKPHLKINDYYGGLEATIDAASGAIDSRKNAKPLSSVTNSTTSTANDDYFLLILLGILGGVGLIGSVAYFWTSWKSAKNEEKKQILEAKEYKKQWEQARKQVELDRAASVERMKNQTSTIKPFVDSSYKVPTKVPIKPSVTKKAPIKPSTTKKVVAAIVLGAAAVAAEEIAKHQREDAERKRREREEEEKSARRRRDDEESSRSSSSSWPSSSDSSGGWGGGSDSGGFSGGSSGGGGSNGDF